MATMTMIEAIRSALREEMARDERVVALGQDIGQLGGVFRATDGLLKEFGADRVFDMPLAEGVIAGSALGLAVSGLVPVAEIQFLGFTHQAFHQIAPQIARYRYRSQGRYNAQVTIRTPFGGGVRTPELHSDAIEAQFVQAPGLKVVMPSNPYDAKGMLLEAIRDPDPVLFCEPLRGYRLVKGEVPEGDYTVPFGQSRVTREGSDVTLVAWSAAVQLAERAAERLAEEGIEAKVLDLRTLVPLDVEGLVSAVESTGRCVVVHEAPLTAGFGAEVVATLQEEAFYSLEAPVARVAAPDTPYPIASIEDYYVPSVERVVDAVRRTVSAK
ncbi:alpha-ketoacid dehydrogenase subunit beta [Blastococcus sp. BMG 814]|uniref:Alpha-ketoacid dehydrogenase subunit beta n=1 Tax=Blastococcus carthaginiensis TaxID=3050034 RepID=A0ABT9IAS3_9ACTN|nr:MULTISPECIES: alpha-ketoacid dehydrogenase subunit beta [Blastococcus]MDP5182670.1 alpha-ketoacid dehydrogenase subunit beta [Blastococcus carthaginiensis]SEK19954.1 pyruvate dehydrogenase E1 component beta subunit [Blastococcus sp. DSM 46786]